jgi:hypothetical protein
VKAATWLSEQSHDIPWIFRAIPARPCTRATPDRPTHEFPRPKLCDRAMLAIGAPLHKWTRFLLFCSLPTSAYSQSTNDTVVHSAAASSSATTQLASSPSPSLSVARTYTSAETTCPYRTINYITHTLPQQCAKSTRAAPGDVASSTGAAVEAGTTLSPTISVPWSGEDGKDEGLEVKLGVSATAAPQVEETGSAVGGGTASQEAEAELETDSPLDNANFLSFEEWKNKNLAKVGQSPENIGQGRAASSDGPARRRPVNVNALDSLGDEAEIELDFSGFGNPAEGESKSNTAQAIRQDLTVPTTGDDGRKVAPGSWTRSKDAGKTCKERFNYASFDCAATVLKTNKQAKSATSILVENKDSYMLNECSANNKFLIVELCDDILVDTVVLANYEFFSSMFRHFTISVSDRYPVKMERWRTLGTFEARNSRDIQPFLITEPQIWARYLRIEFRTQFGNEYYCPLSLLRVHGTTMMEQFRREEEEARGVHEDDLDLDTEEVEVLKPAADSGPIPEDQVPFQLSKVDGEAPKTSTTVAVHPEDSTSVDAALTPTKSVRGAAQSLSSPSVVANPQTISTGAPKSDNATFTAPGPSSSSDVPIAKHASNSNMIHGESSQTSAKADRSSHAPSSVPSVVSKPSTTISSRNGSTISAISTDSVPTPTVPAPKASSNSTLPSIHAQSQQRPSATQPNPAVPSTQESFFKSISKRLQSLETNSTLSLQYIEDQSRNLRDAFLSVERRQLTKTEKFLSHLNSTVMHELQTHRAMYDQLWQSTVIELETMKERQKAEMGEIGSRLSLMADELVWQKRMAVVQSTLLLLCLGLVLFVRSGTLGSTADVPIVHQLGNKYTRFFDNSPSRSPPESVVARRRRTFRNMWRSDTSVGLSDHPSDALNVQSDAETDGARSPVELEFSPPTPDTPGALAVSDLQEAADLANGSSLVLSEQVQNTVSKENRHLREDHAKRIQVLETQSGPATPNGTRDSRPSWEEVDRAIDQLKADEKSPPTPKSLKKDRKKKRSPLRRAYSNSHDGMAEDSPTNDSGDGLFTR